jgi:hypothetical protein
MLAPGHCLTKPVPREPIPELPATRGAEPEPDPPPAPAAEPEPEEAEPRSFLLTLLRALGAIHT